MTISRKALRSGLYLGLATTFLALIGMFTALAQRYIIADTLTLGDAILFGVFAGAGLFATRQLTTDRPTLLINGALAAAVVVAVLVPSVLLATEVNSRAVNIDMDQIFPNVTDELVSKLSFEQETAIVGYLILLVVAAVLGGASSLLPVLPKQVRAIGSMSITLILVLGILQDQINTIISLPDAIWIAAILTTGYMATVWRNREQLLHRLIEPVIGGAILGLVLTVLLLISGADSTSMPDFLSKASILSSFVLGRSTLGLLLLLVIVGAALGAAGSTLSSTSGSLHRSGVTIVSALLMLGIVNSAGQVTLSVAISIVVIVALTQMILARTSQQAETYYASFNARRRRTSQIMIGLVGLAFALLIPQLLTGYINNVVDLIGLYVMMGLGLNIVVGFAGLLDLGYVAFFAIGAYMTGILTTPNVITCPVPGDNAIIMHQQLIADEPLDAEYSMLRGEPVGVVSNTRSAYAAQVISRADLIEFEEVAAAVAALEAGEVAAVVNTVDGLAPYSGNEAYYTTPRFRPANTLWPARSFSSEEQAAWCNTLSFWAAWPLAVIASGLAGVLLGIPVLRLRGDYLAIVTLGFGEIIRLVALSDLGKPYFGGAQGIVNIPSPVINLTSISEPLANSGIPLIKQFGEAVAQPISLGQPNQIYYLILFGIIATAFVSLRLSRSRLGRAWRAMKEDEDVAQAMGINLVQTKLLAFSIGAAFSGIGGAIFGAYLKSIFPNSFTLLVSINVLSLIIIGGLGSIPGVIVGALVIFGLPEALREFQEYRLLMFGAMLVLMMLLRPQGIMPPTNARLEEEAEKALAGEGA